MKATHAASLIAILATGCFILSSASAKRMVPDLVLLSYRRSCRTMVARFCWNAHRTLERFFVSRSPGALHKAIGTRATRS